MKVITENVNSIKADKLIAFLENEKESSIITIHNHPSNVSFSTTDLFTGKTLKSIGMSVAVGHDGSVYEVVANLQDQTSLEELNAEYKNVLQ